MIGPLRICTHAKHMNHVTFALNNNYLGHVINGLASRLQYSQDKKGCCPEIAQTAGKKVEPWPKADPPPQPWRAECPSEPQPVNYDPYRIKVPDVVVPPIPPSNVKRSGLVYTSADQEGRNEDSSYPHQSSQGYQGNQQGAMEEEENKDASFLGMLKGFFGKLKGKSKTGEGDAMMNDNRERVWLQR